MKPLSAVYVRMKGLLDELGVVSENLYGKIAGLEEAISGLGISWEGTAYEQYSIRLKDDLNFMKAKALNLKVMYLMLSTLLAGYQNTEIKVGSIIGGLKK
ncbi:MAG: hypothetical protein K6E63_09730 [Lachnospiraceae bacterium]|nr:hypothetical protein [Lachnospiraceae bacterium]